jgi:hypothetical protein
MGVKVLTNFTTPEGFLVSEIYIRIVHVSFDMVSNIATLRQEFSTSRTSRLQSQVLSRVPFTTDVVSFAAPNFPTIDMIHFHLKRQLTKLGIQVEDVLEPGQSPSAYTEPEEVVTPPEENSISAILAPVVE